MMAQTCAFAMVLREESPQFEITFGRQSRTEDPASPSSFSQPEGKSPVIIAHPDIETRHVLFLGTFYILCSDRFAFCFSPLPSRHPPKQIRKFIPPKVSSSPSPPPKRKSPSNTKPS